MPEGNAPIDPTKINVPQPVNPPAQDPAASAGAPMDPSQIAKPLDPSQMVKPSADAGPAPSPGVANSAEEIMLDISAEEQEEHVARRERNQKVKLVKLPQ